MMNSTGELHLVFTLGGGKFTVELRRVREIIQYLSPTFVPGAPSCVCGVVNLRGEIVTVVDLAKRVGLASTPPGKRTCIAMLEVQGYVGWLGVVCDAVDELVELAPGDVETAPQFGTRIRLEYLRGVARSALGLLLLLNVDRLLSPEQLSEVVDTAAGQATVDEAP